MKKLELPLSYYGSMTTVKREGVNGVPLKSVISKI